jgi:hypothetical protein
MRCFFVLSCVSKSTAMDLFLVPEVLLKLGKYLQSLKFTLKTKKGDIMNALSYSIMLFSNNF